MYNNNNNNNNNNNKCTEVKLAAHVSMSFQGLRKDNFTFIFTLPMLLYTELYSFTCQKCRAHCSRRSCPKTGAEPLKQLIQSDVTERGNSWLPFQYSRYPGDSSSVCVLAHSLLSQMTSRCGPVLYKA